MCHFVANMGVSDSFALMDGFLYSPKFALNPLGNFFSFVVVFIGFASSVYGMSYADAVSYTHLALAFILAEMADTASTLR